MKNILKISIIILIVFSSCKEEKNKTQELNQKKTFEKETRSKNKINTAHFSFIPINSETDYRNYLPILFSAKSIVDNLELEISNITFVTNVDGFVFYDNKKYYEKDTIPLKHNGTIAFKITDKNFKVGNVELVFASANNMLDKKYFNHCNFDSKSQF